MNIFDQYRLSNLAKTDIGQFERELSKMNLSGSNDVIERQKQIDQTMRSYVYEKFCYDYETNQMTFNDVISKSIPSDQVCLYGDKTTDELKNLIKGIIKKNRNLAPADIFFDLTIPVTDMIIDFIDDNDISLRSRIVVLPKYDVLVDAMLSGMVEDIKDTNLPVAYILFEFDVARKNEFIVKPVFLKSGMDTPEFLPYFGYIDMNNPQRKTPSNVVAKKNTPEMYTKRAYELYNIWYAIQYTLLHPIIKTIYARPVTATVSVPDRTKNPKKRVKRVKYLKKHIIKPGDYIEELNRDAGLRSFERRTATWYVTGHWRNYKDGKKVFIKPYWKGVNREEKNHEMRRRELVIPASV